MEKDVLFGREKECQFITGLMNGRKNIIIYGEEGTGKSAIIHEIIHRRKGRNVLYSRSSKTLNTDFHTHINHHNTPLKVVCV